MRYQILTLKHAHELAPDLVYFDPELGDEYLMCVVLFDSNNKIIKLCGVDGGPPEDQTLYRDWKWVAEELNLALMAGYREGYEACNEEGW